ncbi:MAG: hybrid sensor histidine kinase/response regulator [Desulfobacterales bacterium]|nr:MAG: hybrid sensor histidine kinase/response regulator [Desulfobacterales bacterium]
MEYISRRGESNDAVEALANGIAHDMNNLLGAIKGHASLMMSTVDTTDPLYRHIAEIVACIDKGSDIANQLLGFAQVDRFYMTSIDVNRLVRKTVEHLDLQGKRIILDVELEARPLVIKGDPEKIHQAVSAVVKNALQAMPNGGKLSIITESAAILNGTADAYGVDTGYFCKITITDTGIGMDKETLEKIFKPFYTANHQDYPDRKGLGLTFANKIARNHKGVIDVWSSPRVGSSFSVILPLLEPIPDDDDIPLVEKTMVMGNEFILLVDDEERILNAGREICKALGYRVITAGSGQEAVALYADMKNEINLVVLDMIMSGMNGLETFMALKQLNPKIKVLLSTGYAIEEKAQEMLSQGCKGYILKPYSVIDFSHKIREILDQ